jgi:selenocysteine lyase/cysteine desulfurase
MEAGDISAKLFNQFQIHTTSVKWEKLNAVRITPHVYTTTKDLDRFIDAVLKIASA